MSNYRDDAIATAVASDETWINWGVLGEDVGRIAATALVGIGVMASATAVASDEAYSQTLFMPVATASASAEARTQVHGYGVAVDAAQVSDSIPAARVGFMAEAGATASDEALATVRNMLTASATVTAEAIAQRHASVLVVETAKGRDDPVFHGAVLVTETATGSAESIQSARILYMAESSATASAEAFASQGVPAIATASATASDEAFTQLHAMTMAGDSAVIADQPVFTDGIFGQAWTANTGNWAMSRYAPYGFDHIAAVDGVLFGCNEDGVYRLQGGDETINAHIQTGKLDLGGGRLTHPLGALTEYELADGTASMEVTTTQAGTASTYSYPLPPEAADELTNGRFVFGRGLRGRHFSFTLRMNAKRAHINDLSVQTAQTQRRI